jgi:hypothetical protein
MTPFTPTERVHGFLQFCFTVSMAGENQLKHGIDSRAINARVDLGYAFKSLAI